jgi:hypothetical protein
MISFKTFGFILFSFASARKAFAPAMPAFHPLRVAYLYRILAKQQTLCSSRDTVIAMFSCSLGKVKMNNLLWTEGYF